MKSPTPALTNDFQTEKLISIKHLSIRLFRHVLCWFICAVIVSGCESLKLHNPTLVDQVPADVKNQPRSVEGAPPTNPQTPWPRLGDVPMKPKDFSTKPVYDHYMDELEYDRSQGDSTKKQIEKSDPSSVITSPDTSAVAPVIVNPETPVAPQFQKE